MLFNEIMEKEALKQIKIDMNRHILDDLARVVDLKLETAQKASVAWLVEDVFNAEPLHWQTELENFRSRLNASISSGGKFEVSHLLSEVISSRYLVFLQSRIENVSDTKIKQNLGVLLEIIREQMLFQQEMKAKGEAVSFGGVSLEYAPDWYIKG